LLQRCQLTESKQRSLLATTVKPGPERLEKLTLQSRRRPARVKPGQEWLGSCHKSWAEFGSARFLVRAISERKPRGKRKVTGTSLRVNLFLFQHPQVEVLEATSLLRVVRSIISSSVRPRRCWRYWNRLSRQFGGCCGSTSRSMVVVQKA